MEYTISTLVENHPGVLARLAQLFSGRGFNITSLTVAETDDPTMSRMTIVVDGDEKVMEQVKKQLNKSIDVIKVYDLTKKEPIERELLIIKVKAPSVKRSQIIEIVDIFRANIVDVSHEDITIEATGDTKKISALVKMLKPYGIKEIARTGKVAMARSL
ncbi:MAG: acetolactate synthase small subunit [Candidatus Altiarchaeales archaeon]|nr:MAG: acetolactate synthase small subunit [Candidatus Altiarchaeales archaeon]